MAITFCWRLGASHAFQPVCNNLGIAVEDFSARRILWPDNVGEE